jgi:phenylpyruvate tautomerase PptA (4-oxalocrotonate tautomerase family)
MAQIRIYGLREQLEGRREQLSEVLHGCVVETLGMPVDKRFHRFFCIEKEDFIYPSDRSSAYTILEISMFEGRSADTKRKLIEQIFASFERELAISPQDVEITIYETPKANWGIRGMPGDKLALTYKVEQ